MGDWVLGLVGWILVVAGVGKLTGWREFRKGLQDGGLLRGPLALVVAVLLPPAECAAGVVVLLAPHPRPLMVAGALLTAFAVYQAELMQRGNTSDCHCYGRLRQVPPGPAMIVANALLAFAAFAAALGALDPQHLRTRLVAGAVLAALYLLLAGRSRPREGYSGFPYAELRYAEQRLAGADDATARAALAKDMGLGFGATYLLIPRHKAWWIVLRARIRGTAAPIG